MIWAKSFLAGLAATSLCVIFAFYYLTQSSVAVDVNHAKPHVSITSSVVDVDVPVIPCLLGAAMIFAATSYWTFRHLSKAVRHSL